MHGIPAFMIDLKKTCIMNKHINLGNPQNQLCVTSIWIPRNIVPKALLQCYTEAENESVQTVNILMHTMWEHVYISL